jgi:Toprim domain
MGHLLGNAVRFGVAQDVTAGEGIETVLSLRCVLSTMPMAAALSAAHLGAVLFPSTLILRWLYIARDNDPAGDRAVVRLIDRANDVGIEAITLSPRLGDFIPRGVGRNAAQRQRVGARSPMGVAQLGKTGEPEILINSRPELLTQEVIADLVKRIAFHNGENGFCVQRAKVRGH